MGQLLELDTRQIKKDFPILDRKVNEHRLVYLDSAATSQKPRQVIDCINDYYLNYNANVHRAVHTLGMEATSAYEAAREKVAKFINAESPNEIVFVKNATEGTNLVAYSWGRENVGEGDTILLSLLEHHSNLIPWQLLAREKGANLEYVGITDDCLLKTDELSNFDGRRIKIMAFTHMSNVVGTIPPVRELVNFAHQNGALAFIDAAQAAPHIPIDVQKLDCDFMTFTGHKMLGPTGVGVLYAKKELLDEMSPFQGGGSMIKSVELRSAIWNDAPWKYEAGTPNISEAIGLGVAVDYLNNIGMERVREHEKKVTEYALERLSGIRDLVAYGPRDVDLRGGILSFNLGDIHAHDLATILDFEGIATRAGHHCAMPLHTRLGIPATTRASFYIYNDSSDVDALFEALQIARKTFKLS